MLLALAAELLGVPVSWTVLVPVVVALLALTRGVRSTHRDARPVPAPVEPEAIPRDERAWLALGVPTRPFYDHERMSA